MYFPQSLCIQSQTIFFSSQQLLSLNCASTKEIYFTAFSFDPQSVLGPVMRENSDS